MSRPPVTVRPATESDRAATARVFADAFRDDPAMAWLFPDAATRPARLARFFALICRIDADTRHWSLALDPAGEIAAVALWRPPGAWRTSTATMLRHLPRLLGAFGMALPRALGLQARLEAHHPVAPHWYLQFTGCRTADQGKGYGGAAIRAQLAICDATGTPAALETATPGNVGLYQALGFRVSDEFSGADGLPFWGMWRDPR
ncbi:MAG: GNAT family N-acetyltransferase [Alphaproteobacteria bacterium PA4]|nr:MAG: GNAT family N-acetyltransferase [Alphaproteobacteria bacterium PA4]